MNNAHHSHCNQGEYIGSCKYGDANCPMLQTTPKKCVAKIMYEGDFFYSRCQRRIKEGKYCYQHKYLEQS